VKKIVVIGTGRMGEAFATAFAERTSHTVSIRGSYAGSSSAATLNHQLGVRSADDKELLAACCLRRDAAGRACRRGGHAEGLRRHHRFRRWFPAPAATS